MAHFYPFYNGFFRPTSKRKPIFYFSLQGEATLTRPHLNRNFSENSIYISKLGQKSHYKMGKNGSNPFIVASRWRHLKVTLFAPRHQQVISPRRTARSFALVLACFRFSQFTKPKFRYLYIRLPFNKD